MASIAKPLLLFFFLFTLQAQARHLHFFNKVTRETTTVNDKKVPADNHAQDLTTKDQATSKSQLQYSPPDQDPEDDPVFIPQTDHTGYGLYGHQPTTTTNPSEQQYAFVNYKAERDQEPRYYRNYNAYSNGNSQNMYSNMERYDGKTKEQASPVNYHNNNNKNSANSYYYNHKNYAPELKGLDRNNNKYYYDVDGKSSYDKLGYKNDYNGERQGMSDTRFLENGKYYYDINSEKANESNMRNEYLKNNNNNGNYGDRQSFNRYNNGMQAGAQRFDEVDEDFDFDP